MHVTYEYWLKYCILASSEKKKEVTKFICWSNISDKAQELGITLRKADDGMYYFMTTDKKNFDEGKEFCHQVPGFDFPVVITQQQYNVVKGFAQTDIGETDFFLSVLS